MPLIATDTVNSMEYWDALYGRGEYPTQDEINVQRYKAAAAYQVGDTALDIGCGQGGLGLALLEANPNAYYTGWDYAQSAIDSPILPETDKKRWELLWADWRNTEWPGESDTVYLLEILEHESDPRFLARDAALLALKRVVVSVPRRGVLTPEEHRNEHYWDFEQEEIEALFADYGDVTGPFEANHLCDLYVIDRGAE